MAGICFEGKKDEQRKLIEDKPADSQTDIRPTCWPSHCHNSYHVY